jgi:hypothetical protein
MDRTCKNALGPRSGTATFPASESPFGTQLLARDLLCPRGDGIHRAGVTEFLSSGWLPPSDPWVAKKVVIANSLHSFS